jgi:tetratricopeptide (TPR) repeat protein
MMEMDDSTGLAEFQLGRVMQAKESGADAIAAYRVALEKNPRSSRALDGLVSGLLAEGRSDEAIEYLNESLANDPDFHYPKLLLGAIYAGRGDIETAKNYFEDVIVAKPAVISAYRVLASLYPDDSATRIGIFQRGLKANPQNPMLTLLLAAELDRAQQYEAQIALYEDALTAHPDGPALMNNLAALLLEHRTDKASYARALELVKRFRDSDDPAFMDTVGWAYYRNGDFLSAIPYLENAVEGADDVPQTHYHLGMAYFAARDPMPAKHELETAIRLAKGDFPGIDEAQKTLDSIEEKTVAR